MSRKQKTVKPKQIRRLIHTTPTAVDLHFHGAFGVDFMNTDLKALRSLSQRLQDNGVGAICATTLSAPRKELREAVTLLGKWAESKKDQPGAKVLGLHLEGPFLHPDFSGAHPKDAIRNFSQTELDELWDASKGTIRILTLAAETLKAEELSDLGLWARKKNVRLSLGHSKATEVEALRAFTEGFSGVTHLWNALHYHHREAGALGAAHTLKHVFVELIPDFVHVSPSICEMTLDLFKNRVCLVSDAAPSTGLPDGQACSFGHLECMSHGGASHLYNEDVNTSPPLCGGGKLLPEMVKHWLETRSQSATNERKALLAKLGRAMSVQPLRALKKPLNRTTPLPHLEWFENSNGTISYKLTKSNRT